MHILHANEYPDIISWNDASSSGNQDAFIIFDKARFEKEVMYEHFKGATFSSFTRRLRRWNFQSSKTSKKARRYWQPMFKKNNFVLASKMVAVPQVRRRRGTTGITCSTRSTAASQLPPLLPGAKWESQSLSSYNSHSDAMMGGSTTSFGSIASSSTISGDFSSRCHAPIGQQQYAPKQQYYSNENEYIYGVGPTSNDCNYDYTGASQMIPFTRGTHSAAASQLPPLLPDAKRKWESQSSSSYNSHSDAMMGSTTCGSIVSSSTISGDFSSRCHAPIGQQKHAPKQQYSNENEYMYRVGPTSNDCNYDYTGASQMRPNALNNRLYFQHDQISTHHQHAFPYSYSPDCSARGHSFGLGPQSSSTSENSLRMSNLQNL